MSVASVLLVCQFGLPVRGLSPYCNTLLEALQAEQDLYVKPVDYRAAYPGILHPAVRTGALSPPGKLHWGNPLSWRRVAQIDADIIHLQYWLAPMSCYLAPLVSMAKRAGKRIVITVHNPSMHESLRWTTLFENKLLNQADALVVHDARGATALQERFSIMPERIHIIPHGVCVSSSPVLFKTSDYALLGLDPGRRYVCIFGNLRGYKGIDVLLDAWSKVVEKLVDVDLVIAGRFWAGQSGVGARLVAKMLGTDRDEKRLRSILSLPGLTNRVHLFEGFQSDESIDALIRLSELAVFPYVRFNSQSGATCRAAGQGCPVLVSDVGGLPDLAIDTSWVVNAGDADELASALVEKLSQPGDLQVNRELQLERTRAYAWPMIASAHAALYRRLI